MGNTSFVSDDLKFNFELFELMSDNRFYYAYRGLFGEEIESALIHFTESQFDNSTKESAKINKKVFYILVENLQNITRHQAEIARRNNQFASLFLIQNTGNGVNITSSNLIEPQDQVRLETMLDELNALSKDELKAYYNKQLSEGELSKKGGAGLGLVQMVRKSGNKIRYDFQPIDENREFFYMQVKINHDDEVIENTWKGRRDLNHEKKFHQLLNDKKVQVVFKGDFHQDTILEVLSMVETSAGSFNSVGEKKKIFSILVEMLQNIAVHGASTQEVESRSGILFIRNCDGHYHISTGNVMHNSRIESIRERLELINILSDKDLSALYNETLMADTPSEHNVHGLGFLDIRMKSKNPMFYHFEKLDDTYSFFSLSAQVAK